MKRWVMVMVYSAAVEFEVKAETYDEAVKKAYKQAADFPLDVKELECALEDYEELPGGYELADGYFDDDEDD